MRTTTLSWQLQPLLDKVSFPQKSFKTPHVRLLPLQVKHKSRSPTRSGAAASRTAMVLWSVLRQSPPVLCVCLCVCKGRLTGSSCKSVCQRERKRAREREIDDVGGGEGCRDGAGAIKRKQRLRLRASFRRGQVFKLKQVVWRSFTARLCFWY